jgi:hypothetical protein
MDNVKANASTRTVGLRRCFFMYAHGMWDKSPSNFMSHVIIQKSEAVTFAENRPDNQQLF